MDDLRVVIVESDTALRQTIGKQVSTLGGSVVGEAAEVAGGQRLAAQHRPDVVLLELPEPPDAALGFAGWLRSEHPEAMVIANATVILPELMRRAMRAGVQDLLVRPLDTAHLQQALEHARERKGERERHREEKGHVTAVLGVGGGIGTTTIATNVAVAMAGIEGVGPVVLADMDIFVGNVPCFLDLQPSRTYRDLAGELDLSGPEGLRQFLPRHRSGVSMLAGPQRVEDLDAVTPVELGRAIELCRGAFPQVVVDAGHGFDERTVEVLDRSDAILLVTQLNVASLRNARRATETLTRLGYADEKVKVVANRVVKGGRIALEDGRRSLERPVVFWVPNDYPAAIAAIDTGVPLVAAKRRSRVAASLRAMALSLAGPAADRQPVSGLKRLLGDRGAR